MLISAKLRSLTGVLGMLAMLAACSVGAQDPPEREPLRAQDLAGVWGFHRTFGPDLRGELLVWQAGEQWRASVAGIEVSGRLEGDEVRVDWPGNLGSLRVRMMANKSRLEGHWIQPSTRMLNSNYATPVDLESLAKGLWRGQIEPLDDSFDLYLVLRWQEGKLSGFFRNPQRNFGVFMRFDDAVVEGNFLVLRRNGTEQLRISFEADSETLLLTSRGTSFELSRVDRSTARGFYPRVSDEAYEYRQPPELGDGWPTASFTEASIDGQPIGRLIDRILKHKTDSLRTPYPQALLIARHGQLVVEEYFYGFDRDLRHDSRSASKSLSSTLIGAAVDRGLLTLSDRVLPLLADRWPVSDPDSRLAALEVQHLLSMSGGFDCDDDEYDTPGNEDRMQSQEEQPDWIRYILDVPMSRAPGEQAVYCTAGINLLGGVLSAKTDRWLPSLFEQWLAEPLGIERYSLNLTPLGDAYLGGGWRLRPRDLLKFGQLFLDGGRWQGRQVISEAWVKAATEPRGSIHQENDYGFAWWRMDYELEERTTSAFYASGNGGQLLIVVPELSLVVLFNGGNYGDFGTWSTFHRQWMPNDILPAVTLPVAEASDE